MTDRAPITVCEDDIVLCSEDETAFSRDIPINVARGEEFISPRIVLPVGVLIEGVGPSVPKGAKWMFLNWTMPLEVDAAGTPVWRQRPDSHPAARPMPLPQRMVCWLSAPSACSVTLRGHADARL